MTPRERRRALLDAHFMRMETDQVSCEHCGCDLEGECYEGTSIAVAGMVSCGSCAVDAADDQRARTTLEMEPLSTADASAEAWQRIAARQAAEDAARDAAAAEDAASVQLRLRSVG